MGVGIKWKIISIQEGWTFFGAFQGGLPCLFGHGGGGGHPYRPHRGIISKYTLNYKDLKMNPIRIVISDQLIGI